MGASRVLSEGDFHNGARIGPWPKGMTPGLPLKSIADDSLLDAVNVDIDDSGRARTRIGFRKVADGTGCRSAFRFGDTVYFLSGGDLMRMTTTGAVVVRSGYAGNDFISHTRSSGVDYVYSETFGMERMPAMDVFVKSEPDAPVSVTAVSSAGTLDAGRYAVAVSYVDVYGVESAPSDVVYVDSTGGVSVTFSIPSDASIDKARIYCSTMDGSVLYRHSDVLASSGAASITSSVGAGKMLRIENWYRMPSVNGIQSVRGRVVGWSGKDLFFAEPFMGSLMSETGGMWASFEEDITLCIAVEDGLYVGAKKMFFVSIGDDGMPSVVEVAGYNPVKGTGVYDEYERGVWWWADEGLFFGGKSGQSKLVSSKYLASEFFDSGASTIINNDGVSVVVSSFNNGGGENGLRCFDYSGMILVGRALI